MHLNLPSEFRNIEEIASGDTVTSRPEHDPRAATRPQRVEEVFKLKAPILDLTVDGKVIKTTVEHPFYVAGAGWTAASLLKSGDKLVGHNDVVSTVEEVTNTHQEADVYNMRVANDHTYFVGDATWTFSLWVHNTYSPQLLADGTYGIWDETAETLVSVPGTTEPLKFADEAAANAHIATIAPKGTMHVPSGPMIGKRIGHTFEKHGSHNTYELTRQAKGSGMPQGQWLDDVAAEKFIAEHLDELANGAKTFDLPEGLGRQVMPDGSFVPATKARLVPGKSGVKTAFPTN